MEKLWKETGKKKEKFEIAYETILKIIKNIISNPDELKYRTLKLVNLIVTIQSNKKVQESIGKYKTPIEILRILGFSKTKDSGAEDIISFSEDQNIGVLKSRKLDFESAHSKLLSN